MKRFVVAVGLFFSSIASAADLKSIVDGVEAKYAAVSAIKAQFTQTTQSAAFGAEKASGELLIKRPGKMRWSFGDTLYVSDGKKLWIYTASKKQVIQYDDISQGSQSAESVLQSLDKIEEMFNVKLISSDSAGHVLELTPKKSGQGFKKVKLSFDAAYTIREVVITDTFDSVTDIDFSAVQLNARVEDSSFSFTVPKGVEVIRGAN